jgi:copper chaperone CopZ
MNIKTYTVKNMDCASCAMIIESDLEDTGIKAKCSYAKESLEVHIDENFDEQKVIETVKKSGYDITHKAS